MFWNMLNTVRLSDYVRTSGTPMPDWCPSWKRLHRLAAGLLFSLSDHTDPAIWPDHRCPKQVAGPMIWQWQQSCSPWPVETSGLRHADYAMSPVLSSCSLLSLAHDNSPATTYVYVTRSLTFPRDCSRTRLVSSCGVCLSLSCWLSPSRSCIVSQVALLSQRGRAMLHVCQ